MLVKGGKSETREAKRCSASEIMSSGSSVKIAKKIMDSMELLWDTKITARNKNPKGTLKVSAQTSALIT